MQLSRQAGPHGTAVPDPDVPEPMQAGPGPGPAQDGLVPDATRDGPTPVEMPRVGDAIRQLRTERGLTLSRLATQAGISVGMLGLIERNRANPSLRVIAQIRAALGVSLAELFASPPEVRPDPSFVRRATNRPWLEFGEMSKELLSPGGVPGLQFMILHVPPRGSSGSEPMLHPAQKGGLVLEGSLVLRVDEEEALLGPGDSFLCEAARPHGIRNPGSATARVLWIMAPVPPDLGS